MHDDKLVTDLLGIFHVASWIFVMLIVVALFVIWFLGGP